MKLNHRAGFSLVELLVAMGIMTVMMMAMLTMMTSSQKSSRQLQQKLEVLEFRQVLDKYLIDNTSCKCMFAAPSNPITLSGESVDLSSGGLQMGCPGPGSTLLNTTSNVPNSQLKISKMSLENIANNGPNRFKANLTITFQTDSASLPIKPMSIGQVFTTSSNIITSCESASATESPQGTICGNWVTGSRRMDEHGQYTPCMGLPKGVCPSGYESAWLGEADDVYFYGCRKL